jgi:hypothetical protein
MRTEFNVLYKALSKVPYGSDVTIAMENLEKKITEVEKRMVCVKNTNKDIRDILFTYQSKIESAIGYDELEVIQRSVNDINIAIDLNDKEPIENNWYSLFVEPIEESNLIWEKGTIIEWNETILNYGAKGGARARVVKPYTKQCEMVYVEWIDEKANGQGNGGYFSYMFKDEPIKVTTPTYQCRNQHTFDKVKEVIQILKTLDNGDCVDGETMQYILEQVGMEEQMLNQLSYLFAK